MSFFNKIGVSKNSKVVDYSSKIEIHNDIKNLLWIKDGERKNYHSENENIMKVGNIVIKMTEEPSLISIRLPINFDIKSTNVDKVGYYPTYEGLTADQRGVYWKVLNNPYDSKMDISYIFILYYGLERHLLGKNYEEAFNVILKLRDVHSNASFQSYSANALILSALIRQRADLAYKFIESLDKEFEYNFSDNLYVFCKHSLNLPINSKDIIRMAKSFEFTKQNYIKKYSALFEETLNSKLIQRYGKTEIIISDFINKESLKKIKEINLQVFANTSILDNDVDVPNIIESFKFKKEMYDLLDSTHEEVKKILRKNKTNIIETNIEVPKRKKKIIFDKLEEQALLKVRKSVNNVLDEHFALMDLHEFYYKYRDIDSKYLELCIKLCLEDLSKLYSLQELYKKENKEWFEGRIVAFDRLAIIYQKQKEVDKLIEVCDAGMTYYRAIGYFDKALEFEKRKNKAVK